MASQNEKKGKSFFDIIKNLFWILIFLQFAPIIFSNLKKTVEDTISPKTHIAQITINNMIVDSTFYVNNIQKFLKSPDIKALLVKINCTGGFPGSGQTIFRELNKFKAQKPVVAFIENVGASAAYNVAAACNHIVAAPSSLVGSIGTWIQVPPNIKYLADDWKIKFRNIQSGAYKTVGSPFKDMTPEEQAHLQGVSDDSYNQFIKEVAESRNLSLNDHKIWADGKIFTGNQALKLKLIDQVGSFQDAIDEIKKEAMIDTEIQLIQATKPTSLAKLFGAQDGTDTDVSFSSWTASFIGEVMEKVSSKMQAPQFKA